MATPLTIPESQSYRDAVAIVETLRAAGHEAFLAGGCVRDMVLGLPPKDFDIATGARPEQVQALFPKTHPVGAAFGVVLVVRHATPFEVATFRADGAYHDGRRPSSVDFGANAQADVERRDFTLNALLFDPTTGAVCDYVGGLADIAAGLVRAVGDPDRRFAEDRLRMLRAVRFACRFDFDIETATLAAASSHAAGIHDVSAERIGAELTAMWSAPRRRRALELLDATGLLAQVLPEVAALHGVAQPPDTHPEGDVYTHTCRILDALPAQADATLAWGALLHDIGKPATASVADGRIRFLRHEFVGADLAGAIAGRLKFSGALRDGVLSLVRGHMQFFDAPAMRAPTLKRLLREPDIAARLALHHADLCASNGNLRTWEFCRDQLATLPPELLRPAPLIRGDELVAMGVPRGPEIGVMLRAIEDGQLDGSITSRAQAEALVRERAGG